MDHLREYAMRFLTWIRGREAEQRREQQTQERIVADGFLRQPQDPDVFLQRQRQIEMLRRPGPSGPRSLPSQQWAPLAARRERAEAERREQLRQAQQQHQSERGR